MRLKPLPAPPDSLAAVGDAQSAVPLVPGSENDCCARLMRRQGFPSRDVAREWLTFLRALELVEESDSGFRRTDRDPTPENLRESFRDRVFGARETLQTLQAADEPPSADEAFDRLRDSVPGWERERRAAWVEHWLARTERLLDWLVALNFAERVDGGYVAVES